MVSQYIWIGITVGVFVAGIGIGFAALQNSSPGPMGMSPQQMPELMSADMNDPAIQQKIKDQVEEHQKFMDELMKQINAQTDP